MKNIFLILLFIWELPQNLLGLILIMKYKLQYIEVILEKEKNRYFIKAPMAVSLGFFIFWNTSPNEIFILNNANKDHEYGHSIQSRILGPLYLIIVGITSSLRVLYARYYYRRHRTKWMNYYKGFPENWADRLGKVDSTSGKTII